MPERTTTMREHLQCLVLELVPLAERTDGWCCSDELCDAVFADNIEFVDQLEKHSAECSFRAVAEAAIRDAAFEPVELPRYVPMRSP